MSSSDEEDVDIWASLVPDADENSSDSDSENDNEGAEIQDEIVSSDDEETESKPPKKKQKKSVDDKMKIPILEATSSTGKTGDEQEDEEEDKDFNYFLNKEKATTSSGKNKGSFQSFGLSKLVLSNISKKGYRQPTPIQRKTIPLVLSNRDVVGMARTGSGKTAAFLIPLIEKLKTHSAKIGVRAIILSPSRELAMQTAKQFKEFSKNTGLRSLLLIGGDSLEDQFSAMVSNPDVIIATPGRFLHLKVEMRLDLSNIEYIIYDEADRLFEMGFAEQLNELLASLPERRQSMLFSATLPRNLVDFAKAGLINPVLVRLDAESKMSDDLELCFFSTKKNEREANLLSVLQDVIKMPQATPEQLKNLNNVNNEYNESDSDSENENHNKDKSKRNKRPKLAKFNELPSKHSTIVFVPTRHHVEYITNILIEANYPVCYIYGSLDQHARRRQLQNFRSGICSIMVVTDVAARGIDIPILANVINYTLPSSSKIFIHRVGRTARAGNKGWAYSLVGEAEIPYLLDLEIFLGRKILLSKMQEKTEILLKDKGLPINKVSYSKRIVLGSIPRIQIETMEDLYETILRHNFEIGNMKQVCEKAEKLYMKSRQAASQESVRRGKELINDGWDDQNLIFGKNEEVEKEKFLAKLQNRINKETVFEIGRKDEGLIELMNKRRKQIAPIQRKQKERRELIEKERLLGLSHNLQDEMFNNEDELNKESFKEFEIESDNGVKNDKKKSFKDKDFFLSYYAPRDVIQDEQMNISNTGAGNGNGNGSGFINEVNKASFDIDGEEGKKNKGKLVWEKNKYVRKQDDKKYIIGESGHRIPATFRSGKYEEWKAKNKVGNIRVGSKENINKIFDNGNELNGGRIGGRMKHKQNRAPKMPMKGRDDYDTKKKKVEAAVERGVKVKGWNVRGQGKNEIRSSGMIQKRRAEKEKRQAKNGRPSKRR